MEAKDIIDQIKQGTVAPIYMLCGDESFYIDEVTKYIEENLMDASAKAFNQVVAYGKEINVRRIVDEATQYPMMAERRLIIVKEAQDMRDLKELAEYAQKPSPHSVVVLAHKQKNFPKTTKLAKAIVKNGVFFQSKKMYDSKLPAWIDKYCKGQNLRLENGVNAMIADYLGNDLSKITNEIEKLKLNLKGETTVTQSMVHEHIGQSKEYNVFELQKALSNKDISKVNKIVQYFANNEKSHPVQMIISSLFSYFDKVHMVGQNLRASDNDLKAIAGLPSPYFAREYKQAAGHYPTQKVRQIMLMLSQADLSSKGVENRSKSGGDILKELIYGILH